MAQAGAIIGLVAAGVSIYGGITGGKEEEKVMSNPSSVEVQRGVRKAADRDRSFR